MLFSRTFILFFASISVASQNPTISEDAAMNLAVSRYEQPLTQHIDTVVQELGKVHKRAEAYNGGWWQSYKLGKELQYLHEALQDAGDKADDSEHLSQSESADVMNSLQGFAPAMKSIVDSFESHRDIITQSRWKSRMEDGIKELSETSKSFFASIKAKIVDEDKEAVQSLSDDTVAEYGKAEKEVESTE